MDYEEAGRRRAARRGRAEQLGAFVDVGQVVEVDGQRIEFVRTLADCVATIVEWRRPF